jgi:hypothetical protein
MPNGDRTHLQLLFTDSAILNVYDKVMSTKFTKNIYLYAVPKRRVTQNSAEKRWCWLCQCQGKKGSGTPFRLASFLERTFGTAFQCVPSQKHPCLYVNTSVIYLAEIFCQTSLIILFCSIFHSLSLQ